MRGSRGGMGGGPDPPPGICIGLISPILLEMKKIVIFYMCVLPQLYVKQNQSYLRLDPPLEKFSGSAPVLSYDRGISNSCLAYTNFFVHKFWHVTVQIQNTV